MGIRVRIDRNYSSQIGALLGAHLVKIDKRTLTKAQRAAMGLAPKRPPKRSGPHDESAAQRRELAKLRRAIMTGEIAPASVRLAEQLRATLNKWAERGVS